MSIAMRKVDFTELDVGEGQAGLSFYGKYNPGVSIPQVASNVHGIYDQDVKSCPSFADDAQQIRDFIGDLPLVAHNAAFDKAVLSQELQRAGVGPGRRRSYCTMKQFQTSEYQRGSRAGSSLDNTADLFGVGGRTSNRHDAMEDVALTAKIAAVFVGVDKSYRSIR